MTWADLRAKGRYAWLLVTCRVGPVVFSQPNVERYFSRCLTCGRVFPHYWACVTAADRARGRQVGCRCGGSKFRIVVLPVVVQAWYVLSRYVWRKLIWKEVFWDPRLPARRADPGGQIREA